MRTRRGPNRFENSFRVPFDGANYDFEEDEEIEQAAGENSSSSEDGEVKQNRQRASRRAKRTERKRQFATCENRPSEFDMDAEMDSDAEIDSDPPAHFFSDSESDEDFDGFANQSFSWTDREVGINKPPCCEELTGPKTELEEKASALQFFELFFFLLVDYLVSKTNR